MRFVNICIIFTYTCIARKWQIHTVQTLHTNISVTFICNTISYIDNYLADDLFYEHSICIMKIQNAISTLKNKIHIKLNYHNSTNWTIQFIAPCIVLRYGVADFSGRTNPIYYRYTLLNLIKFHERFILFDLSATVWIHWTYCSRLFKPRFIFFNLPEWLSAMGITIGLSRIVLPYLRIIMALRVSGTKMSWHRSKI